MYFVTIRDHIMIAHSLPRPTFGPAQGLHGATYTIEATFTSEEVTEDQIVVDIGEARDVLRAIAASLDYANLDEDARFFGALTTTEYLAKYIHQRLSDPFVGKFEGRLRVNLIESPVAEAGYEGPISRAM